MEGDGSPLPLSEDSSDEPPSGNELSSNEASRREFLQATSAAAAVPSVSFDTRERPEQLSENLFLFPDTCNVYLIRRQKRALLIDFGSGRILDHLASLGIAHLDGILHTHHHRDQAQGDHLAVARGIPIMVPRHERQFFAEAENFWRNRRIFELYDVKNDFFSLTSNVPVAGLLNDYETFRWQELAFFVQPTPGHTPGSVTLIGDIDRHKVAFSGDLIHSAGKVQTLYDLQYGYGEHEGVDCSIYSLSELAKHRLTLLCPSHGRPIRDPLPAVEELSRNLTEWHRFWYQHVPTSELEPVAVSPHLIASTETTSSFYAIISDSGKALFLDYGGASWTFFQVFTRYVDTLDRMRFLSHTIDKLRARHGLKSVDVAIPSHIHDDHLNGFPYLARTYGTRIWAFENMVDILAHPRTLNTGCVFGEPIKIDRVLRDRETFRWEEFEFTVVHSPGHTEYQMAMFTTIDGQRVAFTGDAFFHDSNRPGFIRHNLIYRNRVHAGDHLRSIRNLLDFNPQIIAPGHGRPFAVDRAMMEAFAARAAEQDALFRRLIAADDVNYGLDPSWISIYPYQLRGAPGESTPLEIRVRNLGNRVLHLETTLVLPGGWRSTPEKINLTVAPQGQASTAATLTIPLSAPTSPRVAIALDVVADGRYLGQITEAVVDFPIATRRS